LYLFHATRAASEPREWPPSPRIMPDKEGLPNRLSTQPGEGKGHRDPNRNPAVGHVD